MPTTTEKYIINSAATVIIAGSALNALANNALVLGSAVNNVQAGGGGDGYVLARLTATFKFQSSPTASTALAFWFVKSNDGGTTYEDGGTSLTPSRAPDVTFPTYADTSAHIVMRDVLVPAGFWKPLLKSDGTGQTLTANNSDNTLSITYITRQAV